MAAAEGTSLKCLHGEHESISGWLDAFLIMVGARDIPGTIDGPIMHEAWFSCDRAEESLDSGLGASNHGGAFAWDGHC